MAQENFKNVDLSSYMRKRAAPANDGGVKPDMRASSMVEEEQPQSVPRPSPDIAGGVDAQHFNARWVKEQRQAGPPATPPPKQETRLLHHIQQAAAHSAKNPNAANMQSAALQFYVHARQSQRFRDQANIHLRKTQKLKQ